VTHIGLVLAVVLDLLQLVDCLLELLLGVLEILLGLLFLFLQKFKFTFPKRAVLVVIIDLVLELDRELVVLSPESIDVRRGVDLLLLSDLHQLLVFVTVLGDGALVVSHQVFIFRLEVLQFEH
jgi:hypothetical protein